MPCMEVRSYLLLPVGLWDGTQVIMLGSMEILVKPGRCATGKNLLSIQTMQIFKLGLERKHGVNQGKEGKNIQAFQRNNTVEPCHSSMKQRLSVV